MPSSAALRCSTALLLAVFVNSAITAQDQLDPEALDFFEKRIRPVLVERCYECHSSKSKELGGSLSLESRAALLKGGDSGPAIVPGEPTKSLLLTAIRYADDNLKMPPEDKGQLPKQVIADFETWIQRGAPDPRTESTAAPAKYVVDIEAAKQSWPFTLPVEPTIPPIKNSAWPRNPIDHFILEKLEERNLTPAPDADPRALIRRLTYDLTGLPPTPEDMSALLAPSPPLSPSASNEGERGRGGEWENRYKAYVDRLLASPAYGERWGRHWLDVVRYADTAGDNSDYPIPQMYKYRNWVIQAINDDMPFDEFIRQQLAGDLLPAASTNERYQKIIATGYIANARRFGSRVSDYPQHLTIEDTIDNLGRAFLGMSLNCARCHNHKFDPFTTDDYYGLYGIFHSTRYPWPGIELEKKQRDLVALADEAIVAAATAERKKQSDLVAAEVKACDDAKKAADELVKATTARLEALKKLGTAEVAETTEAEKEIDAAKEQAKKLDARAKAAKKKKADVDNAAWPFDTAYAVTEAKKIEDCKIQLKGDPERLGPEVQRHFPVALGGHRVDSEKTSGRLELANWIASRENPLTARVLVNRLWHHHFGRGLVATPNDFGKQGKPPTHPELLDWLALRFIDNGWSLKSMHRLIVTSRAYQMASSAEFGMRNTESSDDASSIPHSALRTPHLLDPNNDLFSRFPRRRLDAESIRDTLLMLGGNLEPGPGGPHPFPPQPQWDFTQHKPFKAVYDTSRRSVYLMTQRIQRHPLMATFDGPDTGASTGSRVTSTTTLQALYFLNDPFVHEQAKRLATRIVAARSTEPDRIELSYELLFNRLPTADERALAVNYLAKSNASNSTAAELEAWTSYIRSMLRTNEFVYVD